MHDNNKLKTFSFFILLLFLIFHERHTEKCHDDNERTKMMLFHPKQKMYSKLMFIKCSKKPYI